MPTDWENEPAPASPEIRSMTREQAVEYGRLLGEDEANSRRETSQAREDRIRRSMAYAAWDYDGKPASSEAQRKEFGVGQPDVAGSLERSRFARLLQKDAK